jgi:tetratricopeptide (TPR) repeat protein
MIFIGISISLHLCAGCSPKKQSVEDERITYYYRNPQPDKLISVLETVLKQKGLVNKQAHFSPLAHFFATVIQGNMSKLEELKTLQKNYSGEGREAISRIIEEVENYRPVELRSPDDLEFLWAEFKATGNKEIMERITKIVDWPGPSMESDLGDAARKFLIRKAPKHVEVYNLLHEKSKLLEGNEKRLIDEILNVIKVSAVDPAEIYMHRGANYANLGKYGNALKDFREALNYFPDHSAVYVNMANLYEKMGKSQEAFNAMEKAVEIDPNDPIACYGLGRHYSFLGKHDDAIKYYTKALEYFPDRPHYLHALARSYQDKGDKENAIIYFKKYLEYAPNGEHVFLVKQYLALVGEAVEEDPRDIVVMLQKKNFETLEKHLRTLLREKKKDKDGYSLLSQAYRKLCEQPDVKHNFDKWINYFKDWLNHNSSSHFANACMGDLYIDYAWHARGSGWGSTVTKKGDRLFRERLLVAREYLEKAYSLDPADPIVPAMLITVAMGLGSKYEEVEKQFQRAVRADRSEYTAYSSKLNYLMPKWYGSRDWMLLFAGEAVKSASPNSLIPLVMVEAHMEMYRRSNDKSSYFKNVYVWKEMKEVYLTLLKAFPESKRIHNLYAVTAYLAGEHQIAQEELKVIGDEWSEEAWGDKEYFEKVRKELIAH